jgi:hypothetical protein
MNNFTRFGVNLIAKGPWVMRVGLKFNAYIVVYLMRLKVSIARN